MSFADTLKGNSLFISALLVVAVFGSLFYWILTLPLYAFVLLASAGYLWRQRNQEVAPDRLDDINVCVIGAGFSGLGMGAKLKEAGVRFRILEKRSDIGGTWLANQYPGARCDVHSLIYTFTDFQNPDWSCMRAPAKEIHAYLKDFADHFGLWGSISFNTEVDNASWNEETSNWTITTATGEVIKATHLVSCCGVLRHPVLPDIPGRERFRGESFHSSQWNHEFNYKGKRVALVGSGASAVQIAYGMADSVKELNVFQRTPNWFLMQDNPHIPQVMKTLFRWMPFLQTAIRVTLFCTFELFSYAWLRTGWMSEQYQKLMAKDMAALVDNDPKMLAKIIPDYKIGCKRLLMSGDFLRTLKKPNVNLVTDPIKEITEDGVKTSTGKLIKADLIVYATGFDIEGSICGFKTLGRNGRVLREYFDENPCAYNGITVPNFPNFFICLGPNTVVAHSTVTFMIECQVQYIMDCLRQMGRYEIKDIEVKENVTKVFREELAEMTKTRNFSTECRGWYKNKDGANFVLWPGNLFHYWWITRKAALLKDYKIGF